MPERPLAYQTVNHKLDTGFLVLAPSWQRIYIDSALALTDQIADLDLVLERDKRTLTVSEVGRENLMHSWLNGILKLFETDGFVSKRIVFNEFDGKKITASLFGEKHDPIRHGHAPDLKAHHEKVVEMGDSTDAESPFYAKVIFKN